MASAEEVQKVLGDFLLWMSRQEAALRSLNASLATMIAIGTAKCDEVLAYNQRAALIYGWQLTVFEDAERAGLAIPRPPLPPLFGIPGSLRQGASGELMAELPCTTDGRVIASMIQNHVTNCPPPAAGLSGLMPSAACLAAPWSCGVLLVLGAAAVGAVLYIGLEQAAKLANVFTTARLDEIRAASHKDDLTAFADARRDSAACQIRGLRALGPRPTTAQLDDLRAKCDASAEKFLVRGGAKFTSPWTFWIGGALLVGAIAGLVYVARKKRWGATVPAPKGEIASASFGATDAERAIAEEFAEVGYPDVGDSILADDHRRAPGRGIDPDWMRGARTDISRSRLEAPRDPEERAEWLANARRADELLDDLLALR